MTWYFVNRFLKKLCSVCWHEQCTCSLFKLFYWDIVFTRLIFSMISGEANGGGSRPVYPSSRGQRNNGNHWSSSYPAPCTFGRQLDQNGSCHRTLYPGQQSSCISGFNCNVDYPGQPGVCCLGRHKDFW